MWKKLEFATNLLFLAFCILGDSEEIIGDKQTYSFLL